MIRRARGSLSALGLLAVLLAFPSRPLGAQSLADDSRVREALHLLDLWIDAQVAYGQIPGASAAVVHDQELVWAKGYGLANREKGIPATPGTVFSICSISKLFTSIGVMQQRDAGRLRLEDPVRLHLPWFQIQEAHAEFGPATVEGLLTHASGLPRESDHPYWSAPDFEFPTREQIRERVSSQKTLYPTFTYSQYSNLGLTLAGEMVAAVSGMPFDRYVRANILEPLGMARTFTEIPAQLWGGEMAVGYSAITRDGMRLPMPLFHARGIAPAAGFASTVEDLARFASWQFRLLDSHGKEILDSNTLREMHRVHWVDPGWETTWGLGFTVFRSGGETFVGHGGSCPGYRSHLALQTGEKIALVFMANALGVTPEDFTAQAYEIVAPAIKSARDPERKVKEPDPTLSRYTGTYGNSFGGETAVLVWEGELALVSFPTTNPVAGLTRLRHIAGDTFRRVRPDKELGEEVSFEVADGRVVRMWRNNNFMEKLR
jgi:CubicO group peptidase (beta-lactamase class C family)